MEDKDKNVQETKREPSKTGSTAIRYGTYIVITLIVLYFLAKFILPMFGG